MTCLPVTDLLWVQITQSYPNRLRFWRSPCPESPCHVVTFAVFQTKFFRGKEFFFERETTGLDETSQMGDGRVSLTPCTHFPDPEKNWSIRIFWGSPSPNPITKVWKGDKIWKKWSPDKKKFKKNKENTLLKGNRSGVSLLTGFPSKGLWVVRGTGTPKDWDEVKRIF